MVPNLTVILLILMKRLKRQQIYKTAEGRAMLKLIRKAIPIMADVASAKKINKICGNNRNHPRFTKFFEERKGQRFSRMEEK